MTTRHLERLTITPCRRLTARAAGIAAVASLALVMPAPPASADGDVYSTDPSPRGARVVFYSYGEHFYVYDRDADGFSAVGSFQVWGGDAWYSMSDVWNTKGSGTREDRNYSIPEGTRVRYQACLGRWLDHWQGYCSDWHYDRA